MTAEELQKLLNVATPGPWVQCDYDTLNDEIIIENHEGEYVGSIDCDGAYEGKIAKRIDANARLIALAPTLARKVIAAEKLVEAGKEWMQARAKIVELDGKDASSFRPVFERLAGAESALASAIRALAQKEDGE